MKPTVQIEIDVSIEDSNYLNAHAREAGKSVSELVAEVVANAIRCASDNRRP